MIPLRDTVPSETVPVITRLLIAANVLVFLYQAGLGPAGEGFIRFYGLVPRRVHLDRLGTLGPLFTSMFLHGGWMHLLGNMLYLHIFGDNVEDRLGHFRYLVLYPWKTAYLPGRCPDWRPLPGCRHAHAAG